LGKLKLPETAVIDKSALIGKNVSIGAYTVIGKGVVLNSGVSIGAKAHIEYSEIGENCVIGNSSCIGGPPQDLGYANEPSRVYIGDNTNIGEFVTVNRGTKKTLKTVVGKKCVLSSHSHVGHDSVIADNVFLGKFCAIAGHVEIGENSYLCDLSGVHQFTKIGKYAMVTKKCIVTMDMIPFVIAYGKRAILSGVNTAALKENNVSGKYLSDIKKAYKILFRSKLFLNDALEKLEKIKSPSIADILAFIKTSKRGLARPK
jgi:UDP-N-acetylglucosamine acyltransferase